MSDSKAARVLERSLRGFRGQLTAADAATRSGLSTPAAAEGLAALSAEYSGHLAVTSKGELIYEFPRGLVRTGKPGVLRRIGGALAKAVTGVVRFVVRAWVSVVLIGYAVVFGAVLIAIAAKSDDDGGVGDALGGLLRLLLEAMFWTFHPFTSFSLLREPRQVAGPPNRKGIADVPFYERVNRFVFGPPPPSVDPRLEQKQALAEIRRQQGRVVPADVMRVTGANREAAERTLLRLVADHEGEITVSDDGAILYEFPALRSTAARAEAYALTPGAPIWQELAKVRPLTGNGTGTNVLVGVVNSFNLVLGAVALANGWTIERLIEIVARVGVQDAPPLSPPDGMPLVLGLIPFAFSSLLFALPLARLFRRGAEAARVANDNRARLLLKNLFAPQEVEPRFQFTLAELADACTIDGRRPTQAEVERAVRTLGGTVDLGEDGKLIYVFDDLAREHDAVLRSRALASPDEARPGKVLLSSASKGHGLVDDDDDPPRPGERSRH